MCIVYIIKLNWNYWIKSVFILFSVVEVLICLKGTEYLDNPSELSEFTENKFKIL